MPDALNQIILDVSRLSAAAIVGAVDRAPTRRLRWRARPWSTCWAPTRLAADPLPRGMSSPMPAAPVGTLTVARDWDAFHW